MKSEEDKCTPEGDRWLEKISCTHCKGTGKKTSRKKIKCTQCSGIGYVEDIKKNDVICQKCKGHRVVTQKSDTDCVECKGKGYLPKIMQRFLCDKTCEFCLGEGFEKVETEESEECEDYDGMGWSEKINCTACDGDGYTSYFENREV